MMNTYKRFPVEIFAGCIFTFTLVFCLLPGTFRLICALGILLSVIALFTRKKVLLLLGVFVMFIASVMEFTDIIAGYPIKDGVVIRDKASYLSRILPDLIPAFLTLAGLAAAVFIVAMNLLKFSGKTAKKIWFVPAVCWVVSYAVNNDEFSDYGHFAYLFKLLVAAGLFFAMLWITEDGEQKNALEESEKPAGYKNALAIVGGCLYILIFILNSATSVNMSIFAVIDLIMAGLLLSRVKKASLYNSCFVVLGVFQLLKVKSFFGMEHLLKSSYSYFSFQYSKNILDLIPPILVFISYAAAVCFIAVLSSRKKKNIGGNFKHFWFFPGLIYSFALILGIGIGYRTLSIGLGSFLDAAAMMLTLSFLAI